MAAASNRAARLTKLVSDLKKRYKPTAPPQRPLFETILFATLLENSPPEAATKSFIEIEAAYYDWNEVRVSSRSELAEHMKGLTDPQGSADRLKRTVQAIFETFYKFDLEELKKQNLGQAVKTITDFDGVTPFVMNYATQNGLAGHAIACNEGVLLSLQVMDIITEAEAKKGQVPGLERAIPKSKGIEAMLLLHELGVEVGRNPYGPAAKKLLTELDPSCKDRLPKKPKPEEPAPVVEAPAEKPAEKAAVADKKGAKEADDKKVAAKKPAAPVADAKGKPAANNPAAPVKKAPEKAEKSVAKAPEKKPAAAPAKAPAKKVEAKKEDAKKPAPKKPAPPAKKPTTKKPAAASASAKKKPATKAAPKPAAKKAADKKPAKRKPK